MSQHPPHNSDRRRSPRWPLTSPIKLKCVETGRFIPAESRDASWGGLRVRPGQTTNLRVGQPVEVSLPADGQRGLIKAEAMVPAVVVRIDQAGDLGIQLGITASKLAA
ncbi:PilZ domain-containing protein [Mucisphaera sp.]|uniref:PilZ domain-containing protein n=1 Tax=Mucisphaera sp. TaxID=2913024 RepID=UPI003D12864C